MFTKKLHHERMSSILTDPAKADFLELMWKCLFYLCFRDVVGKARRMQYPLGAQYALSSS